MLLYSFRTLYQRHRRSMLIDSSYSLSSDHSASNQQVFLQDVIVGPQVA